VALRTQHGISSVGLAAPAPDGERVRYDAPLGNSAPLVHSAYGGASGYRRSGVLAPLVAVLGRAGPDDCPRPPGAVKRPKRSLAFSYGNPFCMGLLYGRAGRLTALFGGFRPGQWG
jgi:hypothetical protein